MSKLAEQKCLSCRGGIPPLTDAEMISLLLQVTSWRVQEVDGILRLERVFKFKDYSEALDFTNKVGALAEEEDHYPLIVTEWGRVKIYCLTIYPMLVIFGYHYV